MSDVSQDQSSDPSSDGPDQAQPDTMRENYRQLTDTERLYVTDIKTLGANFYDVCNVIGASRELSLAKTKIEEAVMWAVKHITR